MNALKLLTDDHRKHEELLGKLRSDRHYSEFRDELIRHVHIEEEIFYLATSDYLNDVGAQMRIQKKETDPEQVLYPDEEKQEEKFFSRVRSSPPASP